MTTTERPLRADAERNRQSIICAAGKVFAERGTDVTLEYIAEVAGVGVGTIYRRFSSVAELVAVVLDEKMKRYADRTEAAAEQAATDPRGAFEDYILYILQQQADDLAFSEQIVAPSGVSNVFRGHIHRTLRASTILIERAQAAGTLRPDFDHSDIYLLLQANAGLVRATRSSAPDAWQRLGRYMLQAFRHPGDEPLPPVPTVWARARRAGD